MSGAAMEGSESRAAAAAATKDKGGGGGVDDDDEEDGTSNAPYDKRLASHVVPPSHILSDGRFFHLPPPTDRERAGFFERSIARYGLISAGDTGGGVEEKKGGGGGGDDDDGAAAAKLDVPGRDDDRSDSVAGGGGAGTSARGGRKSTKDGSAAADDEPRVHPLAVASARLQGNGVSELSKAINLAGLVGGQEYFGLSNVVVNADKDGGTSAQEKAPSDAAKPSERDSTTASDETVQASGGPSSATAAGGASASGAKTVTDDEDAGVSGENDRLRSSFLLKRKRSQFSDASDVLSRHGRRLSTAIAAQRVVDRRLLSLRKRWRLVAPEHGTRSVGPVRPTEVVAIDVEVYDRDRTGGGSMALVGEGGEGGATATRLGRIARMVPRFATVELKDDYDLDADADLVELQRRREALKTEDDAKMDTGEDSDRNSSTACPPTNGDGSRTMAEPFAIADPTLGKIDLDFDPNRVPMLTLLLAIEKSSTGFSQSASLSSSFLGTDGGNDSDGGGGGGGGDQNNEMNEDEKVVVALQHSLFCASLFESIRREIAAGGGGGGGGPGTTAQGKSAAVTRAQQPAVWLSSEMDESFLPPPSLMVRNDESSSGDGDGAAAGLCVVHCHEGEVKVQLDAEYSLMIKLVEAGTAAAAAGGAEGKRFAADDGAGPDATTRGGGGGGRRPDSGSQSPAQLRALCRALLLHAQFVYHDHRMETSAGGAAAAASGGTSEKRSNAMGHAVVKKRAGVKAPHILRSCVGLGSKMLFERKVRFALQRVSSWLKNNLRSDKRLAAEWLPLSLFDLHSQFALTVGDLLCIDVGIDGDRLRATTFGDDGEFRSVGFGSDVEFELYLRSEIRKRVKRT